MTKPQDKLADAKLCPSCQATDNNPYVDVRGVQMRACGRCMVQWEDADYRKSTPGPSATNARELAERILLLVFQNQAFKAELWPAKVDHIAYLIATELLESSSLQPQQVNETLSHTRSCPVLGNQDADCTCGLQWRIALQTEQTMHAAWRKRAEEAEAKVPQRVTAEMVNIARCQVTYEGDLLEQMAASINAQLAAQVTTPPVDLQNEVERLKRELSDKQHALDLWKQKATERSSRERRTV